MNAEHNTGNKRVNQLGIAAVVLAILGVVVYFLSKPKKVGYDRVSSVAAAREAKAAKAALKNQELEKLNDQENEAK